MCMHTIQTSMLCAVSRVVVGATATLFRTGGTFIESINIQLERGMVRERSVW
jgi:hypothetical protein